MPSPMIHLLVAYEINPKAPDLFWVGNFAPDYINDRQKKMKFILEMLKTVWKRLDN